MPTDRPVISRMADNWRQRAAGGHPTRDRAQEFFRAFRAGEKPIAKGIAAFLERLAQRPREGTETASTGQPSGILGQPMNMTQWRTPNPEPTGGFGAAPPGQVPVAGDQRVSPPQGSIDPFAGPHAEYVTERLTQLLPILPSNVQQGLAPMLTPQQSTPRTMPTPPVMPMPSFPAMPIQMPQTGQADLPTAQAPPPPTPAPPPMEVDWNPWAMLSGQGGGKSPFSLSPPQPMPNMPDPFSGYQSIAPSFGPHQRPGLSPPTMTPPRMGGFGFQPRMRFAPRGTGVLG